MDDSPALLHHQAIRAALVANWEEAIKYNQQIIDKYPGNVDALNRAGRAYFELCDLGKAKKHFEEALRFDPYNQIAQKFLKRIETFRKKGLKQPHPYNLINSVDNDLFIEEPGKTKLVSLLKVAEPHKLSLLSAGVPAVLVIKNRGITVTDQDGDYLGVLPDDLSHHLVKLIRGGNKYQVCLKTVKTNSLSILIRETHRCPRFKNQPTFLEGLNTYLTYSSDHIIVRDEEEELLPREDLDEEKEELEG